VTEAKRRNEGSISKATLPRSHTHLCTRRPTRISLPGFQTQPNSSSALPPLPQYHVSRLVLTYPSFCSLFQGAYRRSRPNGHEECSFFSFGTVRKGLGALARSLGSRRWNRCPLRTCTSWNLPVTCAVFNVTLLGSGLVQLLSVTPIVKNGVLVKLPLVRVPFVFYLFLSSLHRHIPLP
jgi:hypothetical protein